MKIKLDENLPQSLASSLIDLGHDVHTVYDEDLVGCLDADLWRAAQSEGRFLVTQDLDFSDSRLYEPGTHSGILLVRLGSPGREALRKHVLARFASEDVESWVSCIVVSTATKLRIRRPEAPGE